MRRLCCVKKEVHPKSLSDFLGAWLMEEIKKLKGERGEGKGEECGVQKMPVDGREQLLFGCYMRGVGSGWGGVVFVCVGGFGRRGCGIGVIGAKRLEIRNTGGAGWIK